MTDKETGNDKLHAISGFLATLTGTEYPVRELRPTILQLTAGNLANLAVVFTASLKNPTINWVAVRNIFRLFQTDSLAAFASDWLTSLGANPPQYVISLDYRGVLISITLVPKTPYPQNSLHLLRRPNSRHVQGWAKINFPKPKGD